MFLSRTGIATDHLENRVLGLDIIDEMAIDSDITRAQHHYSHKRNGTISPRDFVGTNPDST